MKHRFLVYSGFFILLMNTLMLTTIAQPPLPDSVIAEKLLYHPIHLNPNNQTILPWYATDIGKSYHFVITKVWDFWNTMRTDKNGLPYYMNHQVWRSDFNDRRGIGGDQFAMALSSWNLYYGYSGNEAVKEEMKFIADYYLTHSLSPSNAAWPHIPYPYNSLLYAGIYDSDMVLGKGFTQPDKAGSFGYELLKLYKMNAPHIAPGVADQQYINAAIKIANTLAEKTTNGDANNSPLPFKVNAITGAIGVLKNHHKNNQEEQLSNYTSNWAGTMELFLNLIALKEGNTVAYQKAFDIILNWMKLYPLKNNKWGPFFEDIPGWSDTQINAISFAQFMMNHTNYFPNWKSEVKGIFNWVYEKLGNTEWKKYGVTVVNEQTAYQTPGNSHTARQAAAELQYALLSQDTSTIKNAIRQLNWATYMVDYDGKNCYPRDEVWMTDGYGDYIRHYLKAMAYKPDLAPSNQNHLLSTSSVIQLMEYTPNINQFLVPEVPHAQAKNTLISYRTFDKKSVEVFRMAEKPAGVFANYKKLNEIDQTGTDGWKWEKMDQGGVLTIQHLNANKIYITSQ